MRKIAILGAIAAAALAVPAQADEGRVEARGGIAWANGNEEAIVGAAAGYDFDLGEKVFFGVEGSADKVLDGDADVIFGLTGRLGVKIGEPGKLFGTAGYSFNDGDAFHLGAGYEHKVAEKVYLKAEYRHFFDTVDVNTVVVGVGVNF